MNNHSHLYHEWNGPYKFGIKATEESSKQKVFFWGVDGPTVNDMSGFGPYSHTSAPHLSTTDKDEAVRMSMVANMAYQVGRAHAQNEIREALGLE